MSDLHLPRHARVLPSFAVRYVSHSLSADIGTVNRQELLAWTAQALPSALTASKLRDQFVNRKRPIFDRLWSDTVNVKLTENWRLYLTDEELTRARHLAEADLPSMTLRQVKNLLNLKVSAVLGILAKIESVYWTPNAQARTAFPAATAIPDVQVTPEFATELRHCLTASWVASLKPEDLRFPAISVEPVLVWAERQAAATIITAEAQAYCARLLAANRATWREELEDIMHKAIEHAPHRPSTQLGKDRWIAMGIMRFSGPKLAGYQEIGDAYGEVTRQRVQKIYESIEIGLTSYPIAAPALEKVLDAAARAMPLDVDEADRQLARLLGNGPGLLSAIAFADIIGLNSPVQKISRNLRTRDGSVKRVGFMENTQEPATWVSAALALARRDCTFVGCSNFIRIAGMLALDHGVGVDLDTLISILSQAPGFKTLDRERFWFTQADSDTSAAAIRLKKLMSICSLTDVDMVATVLATDDRWLDGSHAHALPPVHVLAAMVGTWSWVKVNGHNKFRVSHPISPADILSESELGLMQVIQKMGGAATRAELVTGLTDRMEITHHAVSFMLARSPIIRKLEHGLYALQSPLIEVNGLIEGRKRRSLELGRPIDVAERELDSSQPIRVLVNQSGSVVGMNRRVVYLPVYLGPKLVGKYAHAAGELGPIEAKKNNQVRGLASAATARSIGPGERFEVVFDLAGQTYEITKLASTSKP